MPIMNSPMMLLIPARIGRAAANTNSAPTPRSTPPTPTCLAGTRAESRAGAPAVPLGDDPAAAPLAGHVAVDFVIGGRDDLLADSASRSGRPGGTLRALELQIACGRCLVAHGRAPVKWKCRARPNLW